MGRGFGSNPALIQASGEWIFVAGKAWVGGGSGAYAFCT